MAKIKDIKQLPSLSKAERIRAEFHNLDTLILWDKINELVVNNNQILKELKVIRKG